MDDTFLTDLEFETLSDDELKESIRNLCHVMFYAMEGGSVMINIQGKALKPSSVAEGLRAMADSIEHDGIPEGARLIRIRPLN